MIQYHIPLSFEDQSDRGRWASEIERRRPRPDYDGNYLEEETGGGGGGGLFPIRKRKARDVASPYGCSFLEIRLITVSAAYANHGLFNRVLLITIGIYEVVVK